MLQKGLNTEIKGDKEFFKDKKIAIVRTDYFKEMIDRLEGKCVDTLIKNGLIQENIETFTVPGSWEIPLVASQLAENKKFDAIVTFGIIVKGDTHHFEAIANETARSLMDISTKSKVPIIFEILAVYTLEQAEIRTADNDQNKGIEAATATIKIIKVMDRLG